MNTAGPNSAGPAGLRPLRIGLTGGIASGKSTVAQTFADRGIPVIDADRVAREVIAPGSSLLSQVLQRFGPPVRERYGAALQRGDGLDRALLRRLVFEDPAMRRELEALLHPAIRARIETLAAGAGGPYQIHVIPLLVETGARARYDRVLLVDCPESLQLSRLMDRDGLSAPQAQAILAAQAGREARVAAADEIIVNQGDIAVLQAQVAALDSRYRALAAAPAERIDPPARGPLRGP